MTSFCTQCGVQLAAEQSFCTQCGAQLATASPFAASQPETPREAVHPESERLLQLPPWRTLLGNRELRRRIFRAAIRSLAINATLTAIVVAAGVILTAINPVVGMVGLFLGSFLLMAKSYSKPWRLMILTCLLPPVAAVASYLIQLWLCNEVIATNRWTPVYAALGAGALIGLLRARTHVLYVEDGSIMARRTIAYLMIWALAYLIAQVLRAGGAAASLVNASLLASAFSTAMLVAVSLTILAKYQMLRRSLLARGTDA